MLPLLKRADIESLDDLRSYIEQVDFSDSLAEIARRTELNCTAILAFLQAQDLTVRKGPEAAQLRGEALQLIRECGILRRREVRPGAVTRIRDLYEGMRTSMLLVCQHLDPVLTDTLAGAL